MPKDCIFENVLHPPSLGQGRLEKKDVRIVHDALTVSEFGQLRDGRVELVLYLFEDGQREMRGLGQYFAVDEKLPYPPDVFIVVVESRRSVLVQRRDVIFLRVFAPLFEELVSPVQSIEYSLVSLGRVLHALQRIGPVRPELSARSNCLR